MKTRHDNTRQHVLETGQRIIAGKGFASVGLNEILTAAGVPKGSFYHYFDSKKDFGLRLIERYAQFFAKKLDRHLRNSALSPVDRLHAFVEDAKEGMSRHAFRRGCLIGNLGQEIGSLPESVREQLRDCLGDWQERFAACLSEAQQVGQISGGVDAEQLAVFFWIGWEGAVMRAKLEQSVKPLELFASYFFASLPTR